MASLSSSTSIEHAVTTNKETQKRKELLVKLTVLLYLGNIAAKDIVSREWGGPLIVNEAVNLAQELPVGLKQTNESLSLLREVWQRVNPGKKFRKSTPTEERTALVGLIDRSYNEEECARRAFISESTLKRKLASLCITLNVKNLTGIRQLWMTNSNKVLSNIVITASLATTVLACQK